MAVHLDLADGESVEQFAKAAVDAFDGVEILVSNAAQNVAGSVIDTDPEAFDRVLGVNVSGTHRLVRSLLPAMMGRRRGDVVFVTSDVVERPRPSMAAYVTSKWGLEGYARSLQMELEGTGVRATIVRPGPTLTGMGMDWDPEVTAEVIEQWAAWGFARHSSFMRPAGVAEAIAAVVTLPRGTHATVVELQPEAPIRDEPEDEGPPMSTTMKHRQPPRVSGGEDGNGHLDELRVDPIALLNRVRAECGDVGVFRLADREVVLLSGAEANELFFRAPEEVLDQAEAYPFMTPIFGEGVVFDAPPERRREMLHNQALRDKFMRGHAATIAEEVQGMVAGWDDEGIIDLLDWFAELTIYTSSACLVGKRFRRRAGQAVRRALPRPRAGHGCHRLCRPLCPDRELPTARRGPGRVGPAGRGHHGAAGGRPVRRPTRSVTCSTCSCRSRDDDGSPRFSADEVTGMFISMMFAGHHTTSGTAAWTLIELLRHPAELDAVDHELAELYAGGAEVSYQALREMPRLESAVKEALRLHPPLILLLRVAKEDVEVGGFSIRTGQMVGASPSVSNRIPEDFPDADSFVPARYLAPREEDRANPWTWIPFGAGRHRCVGAAFAMMQLKAIFSVLLLDWEFELAQPADSYRNDHSKMVVQLQQPCAVRYRRRTAGRRRGNDAGDALGRPRPLPGARGVRVRGAQRLRAGQEQPGDHPRRAARRGASVRGRGGRPLLPHVRASYHRRGVSPCRRSRAAELEEMMQRWLDLNRRCEEQLDWTPMADMFTEDATYGWNVGPNGRVHGRGPRPDPRVRAGLRDGGAGRLDLPLSAGADRRGPGRDPRAVEAVGRRHPGRRQPLRDRRAGRQLVPLRRQLPVELAARLLRRGQRHRHLHGDDRCRRADPGMQKRLEKFGSGERQPGHYRAGEAPVGLWEGV